MHIKFVSYTIDDGESMNILALLSPLWSPFLYAFSETRLLFIGARFVFSICTLIFYIKAEGFQNRFVFCFLEIVEYFTEGVRVQVSHL